MSDLIRRDDLLKKECCGRISGNDVRNTPAVDAVEVVRCSQCRYWEAMNNGSWMNKNRTDGCCRVLAEYRLAERYMTEKDHFCGYGERGAE